MSKIANRAITKVKYFPMWLNICLRV